jgi:hypothetical protein
MPFSCWHSNCFMDDQFSSQDMCQFLEVLVCRKKTRIIMTRDFQIHVISLQIQSINLNNRQYSYSIQDGCERFK